MTNYTGYINREDVVTRHALVLLEDQPGGHKKAKGDPEAAFPISTKPGRILRFSGPRQRAVREVILQDPRGEGRT